MGTLTLKKRSKRFQQELKPYPEQRKMLKEFLAKNFPFVFDRENPKPLKIGIHSEIIQVRPKNISVRTVRRHLRRWTNRNQYLEAIAKRGERYALDGTVSGFVSDNAADLANRELAEREAKMQSAG